ncbi:helix-turn-helix domain-containing protein [Candidatus Vampirococcus lugosii]|uniref:Helix-turn-helix domain-containing protein n=1 Tax=Candidatus Vampirococcus lugosii TaxID=2789015 RepID=A0ABS5QJN5_9BACT|nr:helix-turn-helix domain-containing protein [Candidatus Vampirococcus lugosii]MBS8121487.1 hypothetical protein [Candidatus Vampirococcus lugosii]
MTDLNYNVGRNQAAKLIGVSTRTIDRYVKKGRLSYNKIGNKIMLCEKELLELQSTFEQTQDSFSQVIVSGQVDDEQNITNQDNQSQDFQNQLSSLVNLIKEKDEQLENKNAIIFNMQHNIGILEAKLKNSVALPDYTQEKDKLYQKNKEISFEKESIQQELKSTKIKNLIYLSVLVFLVLLIIFFIFS